MITTGQDRSYRKGIRLIELAQRFLYEKSTETWFESVFWPNARKYSPCDGGNTYEIKNGNGIPYRYMDCKRYFSVKPETVLASVKVTIAKMGMGNILGVR